MGPPLEPEARRVFPALECVSQPIPELDLSAAGITTSIRATSFTTAYRLPSVDTFDANGMYIHQRGVISESGVFFLGLRWQSWRGFSFIWGMWHEAQYVPDHIATRRQ